MTSTLTFWGGREAIAPGRWQAMCEAVAQLGAVLEAAQAWYICEGALTPAQAARLAALLRAEPVAAAGHAFWVTPRPGVQTPWASKALDIVRLADIPLARLERVVAYRVQWGPAEPTAVMALFVDRMTQVATTDSHALGALFATGAPRPLAVLPLAPAPAVRLAELNQTLGLALAPAELAYLAAGYAQLERAPTDAELMMFAQAQSEHCRHKIFNAQWILDGVAQPRSLFAMIRNTTACASTGVLSAYHDNAAVIAGPLDAHVARVWPDAEGRYAAHAEPGHILAKVETHNHPTAISPFPGAATGAGGELRDEGATGRGGKPKAGMVGFAVSNLCLPAGREPWEAASLPPPARIASALRIMLEAPLGSAAYNNEFGRPTITGYFRTLEQATDIGQAWGYHKPIMIAGGIGTIRDGHVEKLGLPEGTALVVLGGPAFLIGLGGGAASSMAQGQSSSELDFASVQRDNAEMQRRCQEVIDRCWQLGAANPILSIHDVGAGGLANALPELVHDAGRGARLALRAIPSGDARLSPMELWCNEAQERYVLAVAPAALTAFATLCARERAPWAEVGRVTAEARLQLVDAAAPDAAAPVDLPLDFLLGKLPARQIQVAAAGPVAAASENHSPWPPLAEALHRVLGLPAVADKTFLVTIGDRSVGGLVARDQMVGRFQLPLADCGLTLAGYYGHAGEVLSVGERPSVAIVDAAASARMAIGEALTNLGGAGVATLGDVRLSCNWMAAGDDDGELAKLYAAVQAVGLELCPALGLAVPVGKDSLSMRTRWRSGEAPQVVTSPVTLVATAFAPVPDVRRHLTPEPQGAPGTSRLWLLDLGWGAQRLWGSALWQAYAGQGPWRVAVPDLEAPAQFAAAFAAVTEALTQGLITAYHDRSDGGLIVTLLEMAFAVQQGVRVALPPTAHPHATLFTEELGMVVEVPRHAEAAWVTLLGRHGIEAHTAPVAELTEAPMLCVVHGEAVVLQTPMASLFARWGEVTRHMSSLRDTPSCAAQAADVRGTPAAALRAEVPFAWPLVPSVHTRKPQVGIVREQGVNGHVEMAAAFLRAGFEAVDVHMTDLIEGRRRLTDFEGLAFCGGFSFGDVLGAGRGWAASFLYHQDLRDQLAAFAARSHTFALGVCNGCQMLTQLAELIPGAQHWPRLARNQSEQFEARLSTVRIEPSPSVLLQGMAGAELPVVVSHGEGRMAFASTTELDALEAEGLVVGRYVDGHGHATQHYPQNPNGSPHAMMGVCSRDGRFTALMPHPERVVRVAQLSWAPSAWRAHDESPWMQLFHNARAFLR